MSRPAMPRTRRRRDADGRPVRIALDIDGVLGGYLEALSRIVWGRSLPEPASYRVWTDPAWPVDDEQGFLRAHAAAVARGLYEDEPCNGDVALFSRRMAAEGGRFALDVVTSRRDDGDGVTEGWLRRHRVAFGGLVHAARPTAKALMGYDVVVDDDPAVLFAARSMGSLALAPAHRWTRGLGVAVFADGGELEAMVRAWAGA